MYKLGQMYETIKNYNEAVRLYTLAAKNGHAEAAAKLSQFKWNDVNPNGYDSPRAFHENNELRPVGTWGPIDS
jgi:TPR repeat protein